MFSLPATILTMIHSMSRFACGFAPITRLTTNMMALRGSPLRHQHPRSPSCSRYLKFLALTATVTSVASDSSNKTLGTATTSYCSPAEDDDSSKLQMAHEAMAPGNVFPGEWLEEDHYNGVTVHLDSFTPTTAASDSHVLLDTTSFAQMLSASLEHWTKHGRRGIWLHLSHAHADKVPIAVQQFGFQYHMVNHHAHENTLILSKWLPSDLPNKLPAGPSHHVGVGCLVFHPTDATRMLVVQEKTGPAAAFQLWKMPTGLSDAAEDIPAAAVRELHEETGLQATFGQIWQFRQAHSSRGGRFVSDLFFVCQLYLNNYDSDNDCNDEMFKACPDEIAAIQWMSVDDFCAQERWQHSPVYKEMNRIIQNASQRQQQQQLGAFQPYELPLGFGRGTNMLYHGLSPHSNSPPLSQL